jgi:glutamate:GABA antiporter
MAAQAAVTPHTFKKVLRGLDMTLFSVCAILVLDTLAASASIGPSTISWWLITWVLFFIPYGLMTAELGTTYPEQGGLYVWIKRAFGQRWAARVTWLYWINVALWIPSVCLLFTGILGQMLYVELALWAQIAIGIGMTWATVWTGVIRLEVGKWVPNLGAFLKALILLVIGGAGLSYGLEHGFANDLSLRAMLPRWDAGLAFLPVIVYNFLGYELMSGAAEEMENPSKDIPRVVVFSGGPIAILYIIGTLGMLMALPLEDLGLVEGILDTLYRLFGGTGLGVAWVHLLGTSLLFTLLANTVTWTMGANRTAAKAALEGELPALFGRLHPVNQTPVNALLLTGAISTVIFLLYGVMAGSAEDLFWTLFAFSSIIFLLPYLVLFPAFVWLRWVDPAAARPYRVPVNTLGAVLLAAICELFILQAIVFFVWVPGEPVNWGLAAPVLTGVWITLMVGEVLLLLARRASRRQPAATGDD